ncbi:uncharacterized protein LOC132045436 [Lycium ferocissimum]|uniref:uncharacterized protein LOC132045436 n=1 Tax=Lycium ferocissimum TaxID=112874 RepID=UPI002815F49D|nr:uncharacterized protein LOC132045436 [Lycium ferocissimum]
MFMRVRRGNFKYAAYRWSTLVQSLQNYSPRTKVIHVKWEPPELGWVKCNTDGASRGNPGRGSWSFCIRDENANLLVAKAKEMENPQCTNTQAEAMAILQALRVIEYYKKVDFDFTALGFLKPDREHL